MAAVTLTTLIARARQRADMPVAGFIADDATGIYAFINEGVQKLQELLVKAYGEQFVETVTNSANTVAGTTDYSLPTDMLAFYGIEMTIGGVQFVLRPYNNAERGLQTNLLLAGNTTVPKYKLVGTSIRLLPAPGGAYPYLIRYAPSATLLTSGSDTVNFPNGWERYVVCYAAIQMLLKEESDARPLQAQLDKMEQELEEIAQRRNADQPRSVQDVESVEFDDPLLYF